MAEQNLRKRFHLRTDEKESFHQRNEEPMEIDHIRPRKRCFLCIRVGHMAKHCKTRSVNAVEQMKQIQFSELLCWRCGEQGHFKANCPNNNQNHNKGIKKTSYKVFQQCQNQGN